MNNIIRDHRQHCQERIDLVKPCGEFAEYTCRCGTRLVDVELKFEDLFL